MSEYLLKVDNLKVHFPVKRSGFFERGTDTLKAVDGVSLSLSEGDILGLVGESGCGKSTLARAILQLLPLTEGTVVLNGNDLAALSPEALRKARPEAQMIFQDPYASLNPRMTVFDALAEPMLVHGIVDRNEVAEAVATQMERVGLAPRFMKKYPHEFSGGQRQRIAIARTLALKPKLIIADEPVSALDVSVQAQILNLIAQLCKDENLTLIFISHDLTVVRHVATTIAVMYLGKIVEQGPSEEIFRKPQHPYTQALISAVPRPDPKHEQARGATVLKGDPPSPIDPPGGCPFHPRCPIASAECSRTIPRLCAITNDHRVACINLPEQ